MIDDRPRVSRARILSREDDPEFAHKERVTFAEAYDGMNPDLEPLVGDSGFVVNPNGIFIMDGKALVQFDENKTGRAGGERHWIPTECLGREADDG